MGKEHPENIAIINIYAPSTEVPKILKYSQNLMEKYRQLYYDAVIVRGSVPYF